jgi:hypothetical protein
VTGRGGAESFPADLNGGFAEGTAVELWARRMLDFSPNTVWGHCYLAYALLWNNELEEALRESTLEPVASMRFSCQALIAHVRADRRAEDGALR